jgi:hypothetical protein
MAHSYSQMTGPQDGQKRCGSFGSTNQAAVAGLMFEPVGLGVQIQSMMRNPAAAAVVAAGCMNHC